MPSSNNTPEGDSKSLRELAPEIIDLELGDSRPGRSAIHMATVYQCSSPQDSDDKLGGNQFGYVYQRDGHPNADGLAEKCRRMHSAEKAVMTASGMAATSLCMLSILETGDHVLISDRLYGRTATLVKNYLNRFGIHATQVDIKNLDAVAAAMNANTRLVVAETISNPMLHVSPLKELADLVHENRSLLLIDNTFATPVVCQPLEHGADFVVESLTKMMNGHGDVTMGLLCGKEKYWERVPATLSTFGMTTSPFDCWLAERGMATLYVRMKASCETAMQLARKLVTHPGLESVRYPGLEPTPATDRIFNDSDAGAKMYGSLLTVDLAGSADSDQDLATAFIRHLSEIPYCPSLGDYVTTLSHPHSSSHRSYSESQLAGLGIQPQTIRFSVGLEGSEFLYRAIDQALNRLRSAKS